MDMSTLGSKMGDREEWGNLIHSHSQRSNLSSALFNPNQYNMIQQNNGGIPSASKPCPRLGDLDSDSQLRMLRDRLRSKAVSNVEQEDYRNAASCALESIRLCEQLREASPAETLPESLLLAKAYVNLGETREAGHYLSEACSMAKYQPYQDPLMNASLYSIIAEQYMLQGDAKNAQLNYSLYCSRIEANFGLDHIATSDCYNLLASFHTHRGQYSMALEYCTRALSIRISQLGHQHRCTADSHYNLGLLHRLNGNPHDAKREFQLASDIRARLFGAQSLEVAEVATSIGFTEHQLGNLEGAHVQYEKAFLIRANLLGAPHPDAAEALNLLQAVRVALGRESYEYLPGKHKMNSILAASATHSRSKQGGVRRSKLDIGRVETLVDSMDKRRGIETKRKNDALFSFTKLKHAIQELNTRDGTSNSISVGLENSILAAAHSNGSLSGEEIESRFSAVNPAGITGLLNVLRSLQTSNNNIGNGGVAQSTIGISSHIPQPAITPIRTNDRKFVFENDGPGIEEIGVGQLTSCIDMLQAHARLTGVSEDEEVLRARQAIVHTAQQMNQERIAVSKLSELIPTEYVSYLNELLFELEVQLSNVSKVGQKGGDQRRLSRVQLGSSSLTQANNHAGDSPNVVHKPLTSQHNGTASNDTPPSNALSVPPPPPPPPGPPPTQLPEPGSESAAGSTRTKTVELSGNELWKMFDKKVTALGVVPMLVEQERDRIAALERDKKLKQKKEALNAAMLTKPKHAMPTPRKGSAVTKKPVPSGPKSDLKRLHWDVLESTEGTIWDDVNVDMPLDDVFGDLKTAFSSKSKGDANGKAAKDETNGKPKEVVLVPDPKRRQNMSIFVKTLTKGGRTLADVVDIVVNMDAEALGPNALASFAEFAPAEEEVSLVESFVTSGGDTSLLGPAESFILEMSRVKRLNARITSMRFKTTFTESVRDLETQTDTLLRSCSHVRESTRLTRLLGIVLKLGNELNRGTYKGGATGIRLSSLMKLTQTKTNRNATLLEYLITNLWEREPEMLKLQEDFPDLDDAAKCHLQTMNGEMGKIRVGIRQIDNTVKSAGDDLLYAKSMSEFLDRAQMVFEALEEKFQQMKSDFATLCQYFGEDPNKMAPDELFGLFRNFIGVFSAACKKINEAREREERQQKRDAEKKVMLERRSKATTKSGGESIHDQQLVDVESKH